MHGLLKAEGLITLAPSIGMSGCNSVKSDGPGTSISQHNPDKFHSWKSMETLCCDSNNLVQFGHWRFKHGGTLKG